MAAERFKEYWMLEGCFFRELFGGGDIWFESWRAYGLHLEFRDFPHPLQANLN